MNMVVTAARPEIIEPDRLLLDRLTALRQTLAPTLTDGELELFALVAQRKGLDPFSGQIMAVKRNTNKGSRVTYQTGIDGYRSLAERTERYLGSDDAEFGPDCGCGKAPQPHPSFARVTVRKWHRESATVVLQPGRADWHEFVPSEDFMWREKPHVMIGKCAEAQALRKAFPWVLGDLYIPEEMARPDEPVTAPPPVSARAAVAAQAAALRGESAGGSDSEAGRATTAESEPPAPEGMSPEQFKARLTARGISMENAKAVSQDVFPGRAASSLTREDWGRLWTEIVQRLPAAETPQDGA